jgi:hypothetical protein
MSYADFFNSNPVLTTILTLGYASLVGVFIYMMCQLYKK